MRYRSVVERWDVALGALVIAILLACFGLGCDAATLALVGELGRATPKLWPVSVIIAILGFAQIFVSGSR